MTISSISELTEAQSSTLNNIHALTDSHVSHEYIENAVSGISSNSIKRNILLEGSDPSTNSYESVKFKYSSLLSDAILYDVKSFLNETNQLFDNVKNVDYKLDSVFTGNQSISALSIDDNLRSQNAYLYNLLSAAKAIITNLSSNYIQSKVNNLSSINANNLRITTTEIKEEQNYGNVTSATIDGRYIINQVVSNNDAITITQDRNTLYVDFKPDKVLYASDYGNSINLPVGAIIPFIGNPYNDINTSLLGDSFLLCDGSTVNSNDYPLLYTVIGVKFGGNSKKFNLPNLEDGRFLEGLGADYTADASTWGKYLDEALPNIKGLFSIPDEITDANSIYKDSANSHAIYKITTSDTAYAHSDGGNKLPNTHQSMMFDASNGEWDNDLDDYGTSGWNKTNPVYGTDDRSNRVRPKAFQVHYYIKAKVADSDFTSELHEKLNNCLTAIPPATSTTLGGIKLYSEDEQLTLDSNKLAVKLDSSTHKAYVNSAEQKCWKIITNTASVTDPSILYFLPID